MGMVAEPSPHSSQTGSRGKQLHKTHSPASLEHRAWNFRPGPLAHIMAPPGVPVRWRSTRMQESLGSQEQVPAFSRREDKGPETSGAWCPVGCGCEQCSVSLGRQVCFWLSIAWGPLKLQDPKLFTSVSVGPVKWCSMAQTRVLLPAMQVMNWIVFPLNQILKP